MAVVQRLKWFKEQQRFAAYPVGFGPHHGCAAVWPNIGRYGSWAWSVIWDGWFGEDGIAESKQEAADAATAAWWKLVATPIPRDVESEIAVLIARAPVMPPPNHLLTEDRDYLVRLNRALALQYADELRSGQLPGPIKNLMESLSAELYRRRVSPQRGG
ncbi:hypothetical protein [Devosia sp.]|uniref:hypothetical protein n=1 Tax=Devosia sp. TaxID=1871048 RepID=UPI00292E58A8|nr:hypothetical protein [Devosia sp.]